MKDYYIILCIDNIDNVDNNEIKKQYNIQISKFRGLPFLTKMMIQDIKNIKEALYILSNPVMKIKYDKILKKQKQLENDTRYIDNTKICDRLFSITFS
jgi:hypothetical protein